MANLVKNLSCFVFPVELCITQAGDRLESHDNPVGYRGVVPAMVRSFAAFVTLMVVGLIDWTQPIEQSHLYQHLRSHVISLTVCLFIIVVLLMAVLRQSGEQGWHYHSPWSVAFVLGSVNAQYLNQGADLGLHRTQDVCTANA